MPDPSDVANSASFDPPMGVTPDILESSAPITRSHHGRRWAAAAGAAAAAALVGGGIVAAMALSGGGTQPEDVVPAGAVVYADLDLDPSAGQKVNALRFLRSFPDMSAKLGSGDDLQHNVVDALFSGSDVNPATQIDPWLGSRYGVAVLELDGKPEPMVVLQTTDADAARAALPGLLDGGVGFTVVGDYVVIAQTQAQAEQLAAAGASQPLSQDPSFTAAVGSLGDGVATLYVDESKAQTMLKDSAAALGGLGGLDGLSSLTSSGSSLVDGQLGAVVRFEPDALEVVASADTRASLPAGQIESLVSTLPGSTAAAFGTVGGGDNAVRQWASLSQQLDAAAGTDAAATLEQQFGIRLPDDLKTLLGDDLVVAFDGQGPATAFPSVGMRSITDPAAAADLAARLQPLVDQATAGMGVVVKPTTDGMVVATTPQYASTLASGDGSLGTSAAFTHAVPEAKDAQSILYIDVDKLSTALGLGADASASNALDPLEAVGVSATSSDGKVHVLLRVTLG